MNRTLVWSRSCSQSPERPMALELSSETDFQPDTTCRWKAHTAGPPYSLGPSCVSGMSQRLHGVQARTLSRVCVCLCVSEAPPPVLEQYNTLRLVKSNCTESQPADPSARTSEHRPGPLQDSCGSVCLLTGPSRQAAVSSWVNRTLPWRRRADRRGTTPCSLSWRVCLTLLVLGTSGAFRISARCTEEKTWCPSTSNPYRTNLQELCEEVILQAAWDGLSQDSIRNLYSSIPRRL
ncbi:hypothetical protein NFI96_005849, partial [Prochilodus magdalenae]